MNMTVADSNDSARVREELSAFADGELEDGRVAQACQHWRLDDELQASWHAYHLIGDVLRSDDLASAPARDVDFLARLRARLADEPVALAPSPASLPPLAAPLVDSRRQAAAAARPRRAWRASSAVAAAAGVVAVAGVLFATRAPEGAAPSLASSRTAVPGVAATDGFRTASTSAPSPVNGSALSVAVGTAPRASVATGKLIRDVRLDRYLAAHKEFAGSSALGVPSGFLRNATADAADR